MADKENVDRAPVLGEVEAAQRYGAMIGADLPIEERRERSRRLSEGAPTIRRVSMVEDRISELRARAEKAEAAIVRVRALADEWEAEGAAAMASWGLAARHWREWPRVASLRYCLDGDQGGGLLDEAGGA